MSISLVILLHGSFAFLIYHGCLIGLFTFNITALPFLGYEKLCVLFNIAALQTQLAVEGTIVDTDEERKNAMKYYQVS